MSDLVCRNMLCQFAGTCVPSVIGGWYCTLCNRKLVEKPVPVEPPLTLSEQVAKLEAEANDLNEYSRAHVKEISELKKTILQLQEKVKEQQDTIEYGAIGYYAGANAKTWHDSFIKERIESEKLVVELDKAKRSQYWFGETAKNWYEKYDSMREALKKLV